MDPISFYHAHRSLGHHASLAIHKGQVFDEVMDVVLVNMH